MNQPNDPKPKLEIEGDWKSQVQAEKQKLTEQKQAGAGQSSEGAPKEDSDWKAQARAEKQRLAEQAEAEGDAGGRQMPPADFKTLVSTLVTQAMMTLGAMPDPQTGQRYVILDLAKHHIDMLGVLEEKTKGNLDEEEDKLLSQTLHELRLHFVEISKAAQDGRLRAAPQPGAADLNQPRGPIG